MTPAVMAAGWVTALVAVGLAMTGRRALELRAAAVARACHELRGPITAARLGLSLGEPTVERLRAIETELGRATVALDDLAGAVARELTDVDFGDLVACCAEAARVHAPRHHATVQSVRREQSVIVCGNRDRLAQAVANLIANAVEHGGGRVTVRALAQDGAARLEVRDDGPGLPAALPDLVRDARHRRGRHGHGLAVVAAVARAHDGRLRSERTELGHQMVLEVPLGADV